MKSLTAIGLVGCGLGIVSAFILDNWYAAFWAAIAAVEVIHGHLLER